MGAVALRVEHRSQRSDHQTPEEVLERVRRVDAIGLDPASCRGNPTKARVHLTPEQDGLSCSWTHSGLVYVNPPYGRRKGERCQEWVYKAISEAAYPGQAEIIMLLPARTDTKWFQELLRHATSMCFVKGRVRFVGEKDGAPFPSVIVYFGSRSARFADAFHGYGFVVQLRS